MATQTPTVSETFRPTAELAIAGGVELLDHPRNQDHFADPRDKTTAPKLSAAPSRFDDAYC
jgi:hypothetical protein